MDLQGTALMCALLSGENEIATLLVTSGADMNLGNTLWCACDSDHVCSEVFKLLIQRGAEVDRKEADETALHKACMRGVANFTKMLLENGANIDIQDKTDRTPLWHATFQGHPNVVRSLVNLNAQPALRDKEGQTALTAACRGGHKEIVNFLLELDPNIDQKGENIRTPLWYASAHEHRNVVKLLPQRNANITSEDFQGHSAYSVAWNRKHWTVAFMIYKHGRGTLPITVIPLSAEDHYRIAMQKRMRMEMKY